MRKIYKYKKLLVISVFVIGVLFAHNVLADACFSTEGNIELYSNNISPSTDLGRAIQWCASKTNQTTCNNAQASPGGIDPIQSVCEWVSTSTSTPLTPGCEYGNLFNTITGVSCSNSNTPSGSTSLATPLISNLFVQTNDAKDVTQTTATLRGYGGATYPLGCTSFTGYSTTTGLLCSNVILSPITAYFRYSKAAISPIFCNDIYGTNMISTKDIFLGAGNLTSFSQPITNLSPNTTYYYCAILSNKNSIAYGGSEIVKQFHTNCNDTTAETSPVTGIKSDSAQLNGFYCSTKTATVSFEYKDISTPYGGAAPVPREVGSKTYNIGSYSNLYGNIKFNLSGLTPNTTYQFRTVVKNSLGAFKGSPVNFTTSPSSENTNGGSGNTTTPTGSGVTGGNTGGGTIGGTIGGGNTGGTTGNGNGPGTWTTDNGGNSGTWGTGTDSGTWTSTSGTGGTGIVTWTGTGNGTGTWTSATGSGIWTNGTGRGGAGTGTWVNLVVGQTAIPPSDAIVHYHEGIETVFTRQIMANQIFTKTYGYQEGTDLQTFAWNLADQLARAFGYVSASGREIRVSFPDVAAYQLQLVGNKLTVYEYFYGKIVDIRNLTTVFKNASGYEYYFQK